MMAVMPSNMNGYNFMTKQVDLEYLNTSLFTRFVPNTPAGEDAWNEMARGEYGNAAVLAIHAKTVIAQLRKAGYSVAKVKKPTQTIDEILAELGK